MVVFVVTVGVGLGVGSGIFVGFLDASIGSYVASCNGSGTAYKIS